MDLNAVHQRVAGAVEELDDTPQRVITLEREKRTRSRYSAERRTDLDAVHQRVAGALQELDDAPQRVTNSGAGEENAVTVLRGAMDRP